MKIRLERESLELQEFDRSIREEITRDVSALCLRAVGILKAELARMPHELSGRFEGMGPMAIFKAWQDALNERFQKASDALGKLNSESKRKQGKEESNVIRFKTAAVS